MRETNELLATRTVVVQLPGGETQYWLTDQVFAPGDSVQHEGRSLVVADYAASDQTGKQPRVTLQEAEDEPQGADRDALDRVAWNL